MFDSGILIGASLSKQLYYVFHVYCHMQPDLRTNFHPMLVM